MPRKCSYTAQMTHAWCDYNYMNMDALLRDGWTEKDDKAKGCDARLIAPTTPPEETVSYHAEKY